MILVISSCPITIRNHLSRSVITRYCRSSAVPARYRKNTGSDVGSRPCSRGGLQPERCKRESTIGGYRIPTGSWIYIFPYVIHRDARWFTAHESFDPDRCAPANVGRAEKSAYIPLGLGRHVCIGRALSTILLTSILARILQDFRLECPADQTELKPHVGIVISPSNGLPLVATRDSIS